MNTQKIIEIPAKFFRIIRQAEIDSRKVLIRIRFVEDKLISKRSINIKRFYLDAFTMA